MAGFAAISNNTAPLTFRCVMYLVEVGNGSESESYARQLQVNLCQKHLFVCLFVTEETQCCVNGGLHTDLNQCKRGSYANPLYVVQEGPDIMRLKPTMSGRSHTPI